MLVLLWLQDNPLMQQELAHLYFYTVLERMQTTFYTPIQIMTSLKALDKVA